MSKLAKDKNPEMKYFRIALRPNKAPVEVPDCSKQLAGQCQNLVQGVK